MPRGVWVITFIKKFFYYELVKADHQRTTSAPPTPKGYPRPWPRRGHHQHPPQPL